jgi:nucleoid-associated protein YgaU|tara:strand:- start:854 stop:1144 length:291 start_codon:yes stop_codon:yes gene_type:complete
MSRYNNTKIKLSNKTSDRPNSKQRYLTTIYDRVPFSNSDLYVISQEGDRLDNLANQFYGDSSLWWYIANANNLNQINLEPGTSLRIPASLESAKGS